MDVVLQLNGLEALTAYTLQTNGNHNVSVVPEELHAPHTPHLNYISTAIPKRRAGELHSHRI